MNLSRGDVLQVESAGSRWRWRWNGDGMADVTATDGERVELYLRSQHRALWCEVHADLLVYCFELFGRKYTGESFKFKKVGRWQGM